MINFFRKKPEEQKINKPNGSDSFERELDTELYGEEVENGNENEKQANIFDLSYSDEEYIKMGFYNCVHNTINGNELNTLINKIENENSDLTDKVDSWHFI